MAARIELFSCLSDNFGVLVHDEETGLTAAIDAPEEAPIRDALARTGWTLSHILITHHHADHTQAIAPLKKATAATVVGPRGEADKIPDLDVLVGGGDTVTLGQTRFHVFDTPGHTLGHIAYYDAENGNLFSADALFSLGCGRMFEGEPKSMWAGLKILRALPDRTRIYCGHEYSAANARFALSIDPDNEDLQARAAEIEALRADGAFTIPTVMGVEKKANPFLRADDAGLADRMGLSGAPEHQVFAAIRRAKDDF